MADTVDSTTYGNTYNSAIEVFEMWSNPPSYIFCYPAEHNAKAVTWMGDNISRYPIKYGKAWRDNFGGRRQSCTFIGLSGHTYHGTLFETYIRAKRANY